MRRPNALKSKVRLLIERVLPCRRIRWACSSSPSGPARAMLKTGMARLVLHMTWFVLLNQYAMMKTFRNSLGRHRALDRDATMPRRSTHLSFPPAVKSAKQKIDRGVRQKTAPTTWSVKRMNAVMLRG